MEATEQQQQDLNFLGERAPRLRARRRNRANPEAHVKIDFTLLFDDVMRILFE